jgi:hypothetical protein
MMTSMDQKTDEWGRSQCGQLLEMAQQNVELALVKLERNPMREMDFKVYLGLRSKLAQLVYDIAKVACDEEMARRNFREVMDAKP